MGEVKQTNFRIDQETADAFRKFCEDNGMNQAQGFDHIMQVVEMDHAKTAAPTRITEIEGFEKSVKDIMAAYLYSIEINQNAEGRIREQFASDLGRKDKTIDELRAKADQLQAEKDEAEAASAEAVKAKEQAEKDAAAAEKVRIAAEKLPLSQSCHRHTGPKSRRSGRNLIPEPKISCRQDNRPEKRRSFFRRNKPRQQSWKDS